MTETMTASFPKKFLASVLGQEQEFDTVVEECKRIHCPCFVIVLTSSIVTEYHYPNGTAFASAALSKRSLPMKRSFPIAVPSEGTWPRRSDNYPSGIAGPLNTAAGDAMGNSSIIQGTDTAASRSPSTFATSFWPPTSGWNSSSVSLPGSGASSFPLSTSPPGTSSSSRNLATGVSYSPIGSSSPMVNSTSSSVNNTVTESKTTARNASATTTTTEHVWDIVVETSNETSTVHPIWVPYSDRPIPADSGVSVTFIVPTVISESITTMVIPTETSSTTTYVPLSQSSGVWPSYVYAYIEDESSEDENDDDNDRQQDEDDDTDDDKAGGGEHGGKSCFLGLFCGGGGGGGKIHFGSIGVFGGGGGGGPPPPGPPPAPIPVHQAPEDEFSPKTQGPTTATSSTAQTLSASSMLTSSSTLTSLNTSVSALTSTPTSITSNSTTTSSASLSTTSAEACEVEDDDDCQECEYIEFLENEEVRIVAVSLPEPEDDADDGSFDSSAVSEGLTATSGTTSSIVSPASVTATAISSQLNPYQYLTTITTVSVAAYETVEAGATFHGISRSTITLPLVTEIPSDRYITTVTSVESVAVGLGADSTIYATHTETVTNNLPTDQHRITKTIVHTVSINADISGSISRGTTLSTQKITTVTTMEASVSSGGIQKAAPDGSQWSLPLSSELMCQHDPPFIDIGISAKSHLLNEVVSDFCDGLVDHPISLPADGSLFSFRHLAQGDLQGSSCGYALILQASRFSLDETCSGSFNATYCRGAFGALLQETRERCENCENKDGSDPRGFGRFFGSRIGDAKCLNVSIASGRSCSLREDWEFNPEPMDHSRCNKDYDCGFNESIPCEWGGLGGAILELDRSNTTGRD